MERHLRAPGRDNLKYTKAQDKNKVLFTLLDTVTEYTNIECTITYF